jgi:DNA mismatch repair protein MutS2
VPAAAKVELTVGSKCYYHAMEKEGVIQSISDSKAVVLFGVIKMTVPLSELSPSIDDSEEKKEKTKFKSDFVRVNQDLSGIGFTLDIRGYRALDGVDAVEQYLDKVSQIGYKEVTILHGKGTGQLKKAVQDYLKTSPYVKKYREGKIGEGDAGITVVEVK